jgi:hypothetical protein
LREKLKNDAITATAGKDPANLHRSDCSNNDIPGYSCTLRDENALRQLENDTKHNLPVNCF